VLFFQSLINNIAPVILNGSFLCSFSSQISDFDCLWENKALHFCASRLRKIYTGSPIIETLYFNLLHILSILFYVYYVFLRCYQQLNLLSNQIGVAMDIIQKFIPIQQDSMSSEIRVLGIDLGTTNSTVAEVFWQPGEIPVCNVLELNQPTEAGQFTSPLVPSVLAILPDQNVWIGEGAKRLRAFPQRANLFPEKNLFYDTKNDIGLRKTYYQAPDQFNHSTKIAGHVLSFINDSAREATAKAYDHISVTVPASFLPNQRRDTLLACQYANLGLKDDDLLDEPTAALIDYINTQGADRIAIAGQKTLAVVFDFGGGTCDVSVVEITGDIATHKITMSQLAVSRYHRLGGGDIDTAIVHEILIPEILRENNMRSLDLSWAQKKKGLEPQLLGKAEALKIALCKEIDRLIKFERYDDSDKTKLIAKQPGISCRIGKHELILTNPALSAEQFESLLVPFLDTDSLYVRETEFRLTQSIFSPLHDALSRAGKSQHEIDFCLMVGGSSLIPQVQIAVKNYFKHGIVGYFEDHLEMQTSVARGAAWNSLFKKLINRPLIQPILHEGIDILTTDKQHFPLIPSQTPLPYPVDGSFKKIKLMIPSQNISVAELRFEIIGQGDGRSVFNEIWQLPDNAFPRDEMIMEYRITSGKQFQCRAYLTKAPESVFEMSTENPLVNILSPHSIRLKIETAEEELRRKGGGNADDKDTYVQIARWYAEINQQEKALDFLRTALSKIQTPDAEILNLQGIYYDELGDTARSEKAYREADLATPRWGGPLFNLALSFRRRGRHNESLEAVNQAINKIGPQGPYLTLKAMCLASLGIESEKEKTIEDALHSFDPPEILDDWELGWYTSAANLSGDNEHKKHAKNETENRKKAGNVLSGDNILRPAVSGDLVKKEAR
jgi:molecular chaperone DnaK (HSP70)